MTLKIRQAKINDNDQIFDLVKRFTPSFIPLKDDFDKSFGKLLNNANSVILVVCIDETIIGYLLGFEHLTFYANGRVGWVEEIMVNNKYRRKGIGSNLMNEFEKWIGQKNGKLVGLATRRAADFYKAIGYNESAIYFRKIINFNK
ncbi:MAG TPA: N-acetyltransferase [Caldithrix sp.]|nr:GNAT family N-acetyltransferase [Bacteroidales bacterium]HES59097.1 N-acetyltransferase [Caldithrix sp.]